MLDNKGFDVWAEEYDTSVKLSNEDNTYPFAGYNEIIYKIYKKVISKSNATVLDMGFGTGTLTQKLYQYGCDIYGQDFSLRMIELASNKMPNANLYQGDFTKGIVEQLKQRLYDFIIATYSIHHLKKDEKVKFLHELLSLLNKNGMILIGDVMFETQKELEKCREELLDKWDNDEFYCVVSDLKKEFPNLQFERISFCSGIISLLK
ncbi:class I SAM-dependent methyltransferase [Solobacterium sp.]|uniref:class I SAM-dependent methyltransferase n=1 Tax=Solobacterium sp. TaxID=2060878 RepID=UPI001CB30E52|nr:class I SAM-dependent methyltransferase [Solobacterium sp.]MBF1086224.1 class I SAM-dependent methyltransferase [Solobacterium sp.]